MLAYLNNLMLQSFVLAAEYPNFLPSPEEIPWLDKVMKAVNGAAWLIVIGLFLFAMLGLLDAIQGYRGERHGGAKRGVVTVIGSLVAIFVMFNLTDAARQFDTWLN